MLAVLLRTKLSGEMTTRKLRTASAALKEKMKAADVEQNNSSTETESKNPETESGTFGYKVQIGGEDKIKMKMTATLGSNGMEIVDGLCPAWTDVHPEGNSVATLSIYCKPDTTDAQVQDLVKKIQDLYTKIKEFGGKLLTDVVSDFTVSPLLSIIGDHVKVDDVSGWFECCGSRATNVSLKGVELTITFPTNCVNTDLDIKGMNPLPAIQPLDLLRSISMELGVGFDLHDIFHLNDQLNFGVTGEQLLQLGKNGLSIDVKGDYSKEVLEQFISMLPRMLGFMGIPNFNLAEVGKLHPRGDLVMGLLKKAHLNYSNEYSNWNEFVADNLELKDLLLQLPTLHDITYLRLPFHG